MGRRESRKGFQPRNRTSRGVESRVSRERRETAEAAATRRPVARGKSLFLGDEKLYVRGVTYGTFGPDEETDDFPSPRTVARDFARMAAIGVNAVRTYTVPPTWLLDLALQHRLRVMVGLPWEEHVTFLDDKQTVKSIRERVREGVRSCAGHPAVLCYAIGNEIPASIVRWHGRRRIERFLEHLYRRHQGRGPRRARHLCQLPEHGVPPAPLRRHRLLQRLPGVRPAVRGLPRTAPEHLRRPAPDRHRDRPRQPPSQPGGAGARARLAGPQRLRLRLAGVFVFSWTDEWHRGGFDIDDWDFGLVDRDRRPKRSLAAVSKAFSELPFPTNLPWPRISVVVCSYNSEKTLPSLPRRACARSSTRTTR